jgi:hypothetical protein
MKMKFCRECGSEFELEEGDRRRSPLCYACKEIEKRERELLREWEKEQI